MGKIVKKTIADLDRMSANYGLVNPTTLSQMAGPIMVESNLNTQSAAPIYQVIQKPTLNATAMTETVFLPANPKPASITGNPMIQAKTAGRSTFMVTISVARTGTGSGNTENPIFLFGSNAYNNAARPYNSIQNAGQVVTQSVVNGKNTIVFTYGTGGNTTAYTVSLGTTGEYPFVLNSLVGKKGLYVSGVQMEINNVSYLNQLTNEFNTFYLNEFGKVTTNDLTTPTDLYQQQNNGIFLPHEFKLSGDDGLQLNVLDVDSFEVKLYFYANPLV